MQRKRGRPTTTGASSGVLYVTMDPELKAWAQAQADTDNRSLSNWVSTQLERMRRASEGEKMFELYESEKFRLDNTEGYTQDQLDELNAELCSRLQAKNADRNDMDYDSILKNTADQVQRDFD